jgi:DNA-binding NtrC family response regulator
MGPFVPVECSAMPGSLIESELFGYERGAFTGAERMKKGLIESADGGTLFLDEIGDLGVELQTRLFRFVEERATAAAGRPCHGEGGLPHSVRNQSGSWRPRSRRAAFARSSSTG